MNTRQSFNAALLAAFLAVSGCGGGGDGGGADPVADITPDAFALKDIKDADPGKFYTASMKVAGVDAAVKAGVDGDAEFSIDGGKTWRTEMVDVENGDEVMIRLKSKGEASGTVNASLFVGGTTGSPDAEGAVKDNFQVVTKADLEKPELAIQFPPASGITNAATILIRGIVRDDFELQSLTVNGDSVVPDSDTGQWAYELTLVAGANVIEVIAKDAADNQSEINRTVDTTSTTAGTGELLGDAYQALDISKDGSTVFYGGSDGVVYKLDLETGERSVLSREPDVGSGPAFTFIRGMTMGHEADELLVANHGQVVVVDIESGDRIALSNDSDIGVGPNFNAMQVVTNASGDTLYVMSGGTPGNDAVFAASLPSGDRTLVSGQDTGGGLALINAQETITIDPESETIYVSSDDVLGNGAIFSIDPATGDRVNVSAGVGPAFGSKPTEVRFSSTTGLIYTAHGGLDQMMAIVDPVTGDRAIVSNAATGNGPAVSNLRAMGLHEPSKVAFAVGYDEGGVYRIYAIDLENGDRIVIGAD